MKKNWNRVLSVSKNVLRLITQLIFVYRNTRKRCETCSKFTIKTTETRQWHRSGIFIFNFEHVSHLFVVFLLLTLTWMAINVCKFRTWMVINVCKLRTWMVINVCNFKYFWFSITAPKNMELLEKEKFKKKCLAMEFIFIIKKIIFWGLTYQSSQVFGLSRSPKLSKATKNEVNNNLLTLITRG